jgi:hypothetical protein
MYKKNYSSPCRLKKATARGPLQGATQMDAPVQYTVLAGIPATNPADARHSTKKFGLHPASTAPLSKLPLVSYKQLYNSYHTASSCAPRLRRPVRPRSRGRLQRLRRLERRRRFGLLRSITTPPPHPPPRLCPVVLLRPCCILSNPLHNTKRSLGAGHLQNSEQSVHKKNLYI